MKLFLKGDRCLSDKCSFDKRGYAPGQHGTSRSKVSDFGLQLREKQKVRRVYGVLERQFRRYFDQAERRKGVTGETLLRFLELRLDNVVYRAGFANSRAQARQLVGHNHIRLNGRKVTIPSLVLRLGDRLEVKEKSKGLGFIREAVQKGSQRGFPPWLGVDPEGLRATVQTLPAREDIQLAIQEQQIVELYSK